MGIERIADQLLWARWANVMLGAWLFASAFLWPHSPSSQLNTWLMGVVIATFAGIAIGRPMVRWMNTLAAVYLVVSMFVVVHVSSTTRWNNLAVAVAVFALSFIGTAVGRGAAPCRGVEA